MSIVPGTLPASNCIITSKTGLVNTWGYRKSGERSINERGMLFYDYTLFRNFIVHNLNVVFRSILENNDCSNNNA